MRLRRTPTGEAREAPGAGAEEVLEIRAEDLSGLFAAPRWLRDLGVMSWLLVGAFLVVGGVVWLFALTSTITVPVIVGTIVGAVAGPLVNKLQRRGIGRAGAAVIVMLLVIVIALAILLLVLGGLISQSPSISSSMNKALDQIDSWLKDLGINKSGVKSELKQAVPTAGGGLIGGVVGGIKELSSVVLLVTFSAFSAFFMLKDGPSMRAWVNRHMGVPQAVAAIITSDTLRALRQYFLGVTIVAAFNGIVVGLGAWILGVPLAGTIAVVTFVAAYVPFIGAWVAGAFAVALALAGAGETEALIMTVIVLLANGLLQQIVQPIAFGATLSLSPLVVLIATIGGGCLFGMVGLIITAPLVSAAVKISHDLAVARDDAADGAATGIPPPSAGPSPAVPT